MAETCHGCEQPVEAEAAKRVANWWFCESCFDDLMNAKKAPPPPPERPSQPPAPVSTGSPCVICEQSFQQSEVRSMGNLKICNGCYGKMFARPIARMEQRARDSRPPPPSAPPGRRVSSTPPVPVGTYGGKNCATCDRRLMEPGGYHTFDGKHYCPEHAADGHAAQAPVGAQPTAAGVEPSAQVHASVSGCEACGRPLSSEAATAVQGFYICVPCRNMNLDGALELCRRKHRERIDQLLSGGQG